MPELMTDWTTKRVLSQIAADFVRQLELVMERDGITRQALAARLDVTKGRVSQFLNNPGNLSLANVVEYPRALGQKASVIVYDDGDARNLFGPINSEVFTACWELLSKPRDAFDLEAQRQRRREVQTFIIKPTVRTAETTGFYAEQHHLPYDGSTATTDTRVHLMTVPITH